MRRPDWAQIATHALGVALAAALLLLYRVDLLGPDRVGTSVRLLGRAALAFLVLSLVPTALTLVSGWRGLARTRRWLGLYAAAYACAHFGALVVLDYGSDLRLLLLAVREGPAMLLGLAALLLLLPLAATSTNRWMRRLGPRWRRLHKLAYVAAGLAAWHYAAVFKELRPWPFITLVSVAALLLVRLDAWLRARADMRAEARVPEAERRGRANTSRGWLVEQLPGGRLASPRYERRRVWWAFVTCLVVISTALYLAGLESWVYWALLLIAIMLGWWTK
ncbi:MAG: sulfoxide reductase heme-binding subunit YedZ [Chloroflexi bacterium]|nr:sulfoxide reductase heme-binding subunit YedZ [Chloroflexota bacterium]